MGKSTPKTKKNASKSKKVAPPPKPVEESESDESSSEEEETVKVAPVKSKPQKKPAKPEPEEDSDDSDESDEEEPPKKAAPKKKAAAKKEESDEDDDDSDEDDSDEDMDTAVSSALGKKVANGKAKAKAAADEDDDDDDDDSEDDSDEEEATKPPAKKASAKAAKMEVDDDEESDDDEEESDDDDEEEEEEEEEEDASSKKRKAKQTKNEPAVKKAKPSEDSEACTMFVKQLPESANEKKLKKKFPGVESVRIPMKPDGSNKGFAFLQFGSSEEVAKYIESQQGCDLDGSSLFLDRVGQKGGGQKKGGDDNSNTLFIKNLPYEVKEGKLKKFFQGAQTVRIPTDHDGNAKGFAYVEFASSDEVATAIEEKQGADFDGRALFLDRPRPRDSGNQRGGRGGGFGGGGFQRNDGPSEKTKVLFVKNLSFDLRKEELHEAFDGATEARIAIFKDTMKPRGFGYVEFNDIASAESAKNAMDGYNLKGRDIHIDFARELTDTPPRGGRGGGGFRGGRGGSFRGDRGGGRGGFRGGRGGDRGGFRGRGRGGSSNNRGKGTISEFKGTRKSFGDD